MVVDDSTLKGPEQKASRKSPVPTLRVTFTPDGQAIGSSRTLLPDRMVAVGRAADVDICFAGDARASRRHAEVHCDPAGKVRVVDTSANGLFVNGRRVKESALGDGDVLRVGDSLLILRYRDAEDRGEPCLPGWIGDSPAAIALYRLVRKVARANATVLVIGESGTGKELIARALHELGHKGAPFVPVNCAAIAEGLAESSLFGHVAGAFTGAAKGHLGYFRTANGGVLFLDEIGELGAATQAKLLRALEEHAVTPVGGDGPVPCQARIIAATNRDLHAAVFSGKFRGDLYARLAEVLVVTPTLRDRREDILPIFMAALGDPSPPCSADLAEALLLHAWPFNVRELRKVAIDARVRGEGLALLDLDLVRDRLIGGAGESPTEPAPPAAAPLDGPPARDELLRMLTEHGGSVAGVARTTGRSRKQVYRWIEAHGIDVKSFR